MARRSHRALRSLRYIIFAPMRYITSLMPKYTVGGTNVTLYHACERTLDLLSRGTVPGKGYYHLSSSSGASIASYVQCVDFGPPPPKEDISKQVT